MKFWFLLLFSFSTIVNVYHGDGEVMNSPSPSTDNPSTAILSTTIAPTDVLTSKQPASIPSTSSTSTTIATMITETSPTTNPTTNSPTNAPTDVPTSKQPTSTPSASSTSTTITTTVTEASPTTDPITNSPTNAPTDIPTSKQPASSSSSTFSTSTTTESTTPTTTTSSTTTTTTTTLPTTTSVPTLRLSDNSPSLSWDPNVDGDFEVIEAEPGYKIRVDIEVCDLDGENGDYVLISTSENLDSDDTLLITYQAHFKPFLFNVNVLYAAFKGTGMSNFTANFTRVGEKLTTVSTEEPGTTIYLPTPSTNDSYEITVFLGGKNADDYKQPDLQKLLKDMIKDMATEYCKTENFNLAEVITSNNVILQEIVQCSVNWPDYTNCVLLIFSVPVELVENPHTPWLGYQLTAEHLQIMWDTYAEKYLKDGLYIYKPPDSTSWLKFQLILFSSVTIIFVICLIIVRQISITVSKALVRRRMSDTTSIISSNDRNSEVSLPPHYLQETPPLFDNTYMMYNPKSDKSYEPSLSEHFGYNYGSPNFMDLLRGAQNDGDNDDDDGWDSDINPIPESGA